MRPALFVLLAVVSSAWAVPTTESGLSIRSLVFPIESSNSYVEMSPAKSLAVQRFTLCMRVATELKGEREIILFAYRTSSYDALNVWREKDGRLSFYLSGEGVFFEVPRLGPLQTHLCITWDSTNGAANMFIDGKKTQTKLYKKGHIIPDNGRVIIGQDPDNYLGGFDAKQSFVGEIFDINMWDFVLPDSTIHSVFAGTSTVVGNIFDWKNTVLHTYGSAYLITHFL